jgi:hypothetical protein
MLADDRVAAAVATSREGQRQQRSGRDSVNAITVPKAKSVLTREVKASTLVGSSPMPGSQTTS